MVFYVKDSKGRFTLGLTVVEGKYDLAHNTSPVAYKLQLVANTSYHFTDYKIGSKVILGNKTVHDVPRSSAKQYDLPGYSSITLAEGTETILHDVNGAKYLTLAFSIDMVKADYTPGPLSQTGTFELTEIPRFASISQEIVESSITETQVTVNWKSDSVIDYLWYSFDDRVTWTGMAINDQTSGTYTIKGLEPSSIYQIATRVRRKESQLNTTSAVETITTYDYPYCTHAPDFTIGESTRLLFYNPLKRKFKFYLMVNNEQLPIVYECSSNYYQGLNGANTSVPALYKAIPDKKSAKYTVVVVCGDTTMIYGSGEFKIRGDETPTAGSLTYLTTDDKYQENPLKVIQNLSSVWVNYGEATSKYHATIKEYAFTIGSITQKRTTEDNTLFEFGIVTVSQNADIVMTVTDSRGLKTKVLCPIQVVPYKIPSFSIKLERLNNYEDETYFKVDATFSSVEGQNQLTIKYRYKENGGSYNNFKTIPNRETLTLQLDNEKVFIFNVVISDKYGFKHDKEYTLGKGAFPLFIDTVLNSIGINKLPTHPKALEIDGNIYGTQNRVLWSGSSTMGDGSEITLNEAISEQMSGIVLVFAYYQSETTQKYRIQSFFKSKKEIDIFKGFNNGNGGGNLFHLATPKFDEVASKYLYINDTKITGTASNTEKGTGTSGVTYNNENYRLYYVIGV